MSTAIIICTRCDSQRLPNKPFLKINGIAVIEHLIKRLQKIKVPIFLAYPKEQHKSYEYLESFEHVKLHKSHCYSDPLARMRECAEANNIKTIIRISHDKILIEQKDVENALQEFEKRNLEYLYGSLFIPGTGFEIIGFNALERAAKKFKDIEYIGFSIKSVTPKEKIFNFNPKHPRGEFRFLIDYESDLKSLDVLFSQCGNNLTLSKAVKYLNDNPEIKQINKQPILTVYTCAYNAEKWLDRTLDSISRQKYFSKYEYILIDDHSTDKTCEIFAKFALKYKNVTWLRTEKNLGLSSCSNIALKKAHGKYIMRLDADDFFVSCTALNQMVSAISNSDKDAIYPNNYFGSLNEIQKGKDSHHCAGTIFNKDAINHIKFTDGLSNHDSLDIFLRAKDQLKIGYLDKAMFFYRQHKSSMSKTNLKEREETKEKLLTRMDGIDFFNEKENYDFKELGVDIESCN